MSFSITVFCTFTSGSRESKSVSGLIGIVRLFQNIKYKKYKICVWDWPLAPRPWVCKLVRTFNSCFWPKKRFNLLGSKEKNKSLLPAQALVLCCTENAHSHMEFKVTRLLNYIFLLVAWNEKDNLKVIGKPAMLACEHMDVSLSALNLVVGTYLQPFEGVCICVPIT